MECCQKENAMFRDLLTNAFILLTYYLVIGSAISRKIENIPALLRNYLIPGILSGVIGITLIYFSVRMHGVLFDLRHIPLVIIATFSGVPALWVGTGIIVTARLFLFQPFETAAAASFFIVLMGLGSSLLVRFVQAKALRFTAILAYTTILQSIWHWIGLSEERSVYIPFTASFIIISFVVGFFSYLLITSSLRQAHLSQELKKTNSLLEEQQKVLEDQNEELTAQQEELNKMIATVQVHNLRMEMTNSQLETKQADLQILLSQVQEQERHYRQLVEWLPDAVLVYQKENIVYANNMAASIVSAASPIDLIGKSILEFILPENLQAVLESGHIRNETNESNEHIETKFNRLDGKIIDVEIFCRKISLQGQPATLALLRDISVRKDAERTLMAANKTLEMLAHADGLTGIANRRYFDSFLEQAWIDLEKTGAPLSLILFDIDYFKLYNDYYGHQKGDDVLQLIALGVSDCLSGINCLFARYGGEEFVVLLPNTKETAAQEVAEMLRSSIEALHIPHEQSQVSDVVTSSVGFATAKPEQFPSAKNLIDAADQALYIAKRNGRNRVFDSSYATL